MKFKPYRLGSPPSPPLSGFAPRPVSVGRRIPPAQLTGEITMTTKTTTIAHSHSIGCASTTEGMSKGSSTNISVGTSESVDPAHAFYLRINQMAPLCTSLDALGNKLGLDRRNGEDDEALASRCHYRIDDLIRNRAVQVGAHEILQLMDLHEELARLVP